MLPAPSRWLWLSAVLGLLAAIPIGLADLSRPDEVGRLWWAVALSAVWALLWMVVARRRWFSVLMLLMGGCGFVVQVQGRVLPPLKTGWTQARPALRWLIAQIALWTGRTLNLRTKFKVPAPADLREWIAALDRLRQFGANLRAGWPLDLRSGSLLMSALALLAIWLCAAWIVGMVAERRPWAALMAALSVVAVGIALTGKGWTGLGVGLTGGLLVAASDRLDEKLTRWGEDALPYGVKTEWWILSIVMALLAAAALGGMVQLTDPEFRQSLHDALIRDQTASSSGGSPPSTTSGEPAPGVWPRQHLLGSGPELSDLPVMTITTFGAGPAGFYWRATSYDAYTGHGWLRKGTSEMVSNGQPGDLDAEHPPEDMILLRQSVRFETANDQIYAAGMPVRISQPVEAFWLEEGLPDLVTVLSVRPLAGYEALSWVPSATEDDLHAADGDIPAWVTDHYLRLPDELPERVRTLAADLTADAPTAYDQALALQTYLRSFPYTLDLPEPSESSDIADYFLFDLQRGYCDYFATAMVIMARSVGLPARLAVGYATGAFDADTGSYHVTLAEAHSWPEIYFPGIGWIPFEPTPARPVIERGAPATANNTPDAAPEQVVAAYEEAARSQPTVAGTRRLRWGLIGGLAILLLAASLVGGWLVSQRRLAHLTASERIDVLYGRLAQHGARLGVGLSATQTPAEFRAAMLGELSRRANPQRKRRGDLIEQATQGIEELCTAYAQRHYSSHQPEIDSLLGDWPGLNRVLWWLWLFSRPASTGRSR